MTPDLLLVSGLAYELAEWFGFGVETAVLEVSARQRWQAGMVPPVPAEVLDRLRMQDALALDRSVTRREELAVAVVLFRLNSVVPVQRLPAEYSSKMVVALHSCSIGPYLASEGALVSYCWGAATIYYQHRLALVEEDLEEAYW